MRLKRYLNEKTFSIQKDVEILYKLGFKKIYDIIKSSDGFEGIQAGLRKVIKRPTRDNIFKTTDSSILKTPEAVMAHNLNPIEIILGNMTDGSFYRPSVITSRMGGGKRGMLQVSQNHQAMGILLTGNVNDLPQSQLVRFANELTPDRIKSSIAHELSHWISDSLHNKYMSNILDVAAELTNPELVKLGKKDVNMTYFEIDAQIHGIKQLKKSYSKDEWNEFSLLDLFNTYTSLYGIAMNMKRYGKEALNIWQKNLMKRMSREGLLGKNMRNFAKV